MTTPINASTPTSPTTNAVAEPNESLMLRLRGDSSPEAVLALAALNVEESADRARETRTSLRQSRGTQQRAAIAEKRRAARFDFAASLVQGVASAAGGLAGMDGNESLGKTLEGLGSAAGACIKIGSANATQAAETSELQAREMGEAAEDSGAHAQRQEQHASKAMQNASDLARGRHEAMMLAIRG